MPSSASSRVKLGDVTAPLAITMGDASGVGPEIVLRRWVMGDLGDDVVVYGDAAILRHGAELLGLTIDWDAFPVVDLGLLDASDHRPGRLDAKSGAAARAYVERATLDALAGTVAGIVTMPMNKEATQLTDPAFVGSHRVHRCPVRCGEGDDDAHRPHGSRLPRGHPRQHPLFARRRHRPGHHPSACSTSCDSPMTRCRRFLATPRIAVCGLNPHAGEHGLFGREDIEQIAPAIEAARAVGDRRHRARTRPTRCSSRPSTATATTPSCACTTTRVTAR